MSFRSQFLSLLLMATFCSPLESFAQLDPGKVRDSIRRAQQYLRSQQRPNGTWDANGTYRVGITSLAVLGLISSGVPVDDPAVQTGLTYLRSIPEGRLELEAERVTYELSLMTMALCAANEKRDRPRIASLASRIERGQLTGGANAGSWDYTLSGGGAGDAGDRSNGQYALLALREAAHYGIPINRDVWQRAEQHWRISQNGDGGWGYKNSSSGQRMPSSGSMTVAGIASLVITQSMLGDDDDQVDCCAPREKNEALERGIRWLSKNFAVGTNPGQGSYLLYYLYGLERAGRLSGQRFFGDENDWYREGAEFLIRGQHRRGSWGGDGRGERDEVLGTSFSLLFLSKGMAPVVVSKLKFGGPPAGEIPEELWNRHPRDIHSLMDFISGRENWPKLLAWQVIELPKLKEETATSVLGQSPILFLSSDRAPLLTKDELRWIRSALDQGGTLLLSADCNSQDFDTGVRAIVAELYPEAPGLFRALEADHPIYRSEFLLTPESHELWGIDFGCRTPVIYSPSDLGCFWDRWSKITPPRRSAITQQRIEKHMQLGTNIVAYVTGREPPDKLESDERVEEQKERENIERGFLQIAKLRHEGGWDTAPLALRNLLRALDKQTGTASTRRQDLVPTDQNIFNYPLLYMHGRQAFSFSDADRKQLRLYLERGGVLFADACCGSSAFDKAFREELKTLFPNEPLERIGIEHELFKYPFKIKEVRRRLPSVNQPGQPLQTISQQGQPFLEGIKLDGRLAVIYSKYDLSCALEKQASLVCNGYESEDALRIALNIVIYAMVP